MKIYPDTKVYMLCPGNIHSGGPELCHQLVSQLIRLGVDAYMFYLPNLQGTFDRRNPVDEFYVKYHVPYVFQIEETGHNVLILNESANWAYFTYKYIRKIFWWMSVDNYIKDISSLIRARADDALAAPMPKLYYFAPDDTEHWVQSEYARQFLTLNGVPAKQIFAVEDYLNQTFLKNAANIDISRKENFVAFNPSKGFNITGQLMKLAPDIQWRPIRNMTPAQVQELLAASKVYIDFGNHPGKDRIPREAALSGCVVITGRRGAAANAIDINIPDEFKFGETEGDFPKIIEKIRGVFENFGENHAAQAAYRARIQDDRNRFANAVAAAFNLQPKDDRIICIAQGLTDKGVKLARALYKNIAALASKGMKVAVPFILDDNFRKHLNSGVNAVVKNIQNNNYFCLENENDDKLLILSTDEAKFLHEEGRLNRFALLTPTDAESQALKETFGIPDKHLFIVDIE